MDIIKNKVGYYGIGKVLKQMHYTHEMQIYFEIKPPLLHRFFSKLLLGFDWIDIKIKK